MKHIITGVLLSLAVLTASVVNAGLTALIPVPQKLVTNTGTFTLQPGAAIRADAASEATAKFLAERLRPATGFRLKVKSFTGTQVPPGDILLTTANASTNLGAEGYELTVAGEGVVIRASGQAGLFYGGQTLLQLLPPEVFAPSPVKQVAWTAPCVQIEDQPRFAWRGLMLDSGRHFITPENVKRMIDLAAMHKLNIFHWHLTEDQGWRIEIKKYPKLTAVGSVRAESPIVDEDWMTGKGDGKPYGGFYTQKQIREIVAFAKARHITVIPEIEMPGHAAAAIAAYPEFGNNDIPDYHPAVQTNGGVHPYTYNPSEKTFQFLGDVIGEVCALFPDAPYFHTGGDEAPKGQWEQSAFARKVMRENGLKDANELQSWFIRRVEKLVNAHGKKLIGWDEIQEGGLSPTATMMVWRAGKWADLAISHGNDVVMTPLETTYLCYPEGPSPESPGFKNWGRFIPMDKVYDFDPMPPGLTPDQRRQVLGTEANLWSEYIYNQAKLEYMAFPRLCALAEVAWSPAEARSLPDFLRRLEPHESRLNELQVNYRKPDGSPARPDRQIVNE